MHVSRLQVFTESVLTWRKRRILKKKEKQAKKHPVVDWLEAFIWAAAVVLLINQYLFQAYEIPSSSMENTLLIRDRIFVNKVVYGPELIPGRAKISGFTDPHRREVIIFESPTYLSKGPVFDVLQRVIYMLTLSLVDIDRDESGQPRAHFLIKRAAGVERDRIRIAEGEVSIRPAGALEWTAETSFNDLHDVEFQIKRIVKPEYYEPLSAHAIVDAYETEELAPPEESGAISDPAMSFMDRYEWRKIRSETLYRLNPHERRYGGDWMRYDMGFYVPEGWIFPMGDNRDNSNDGRYFGPVRLKKVLGRAMFKYWPVARIGKIR